MNKIVSKSIKALAVLHGTIFLLLVHPACATTALNQMALVEIRFDRADVHYQQPLYNAINETLNRYPDARFELNATFPGRGNAAQLAIEGAKARRLAAIVQKTLTDMGLTYDRIEQSFTPDMAAKICEIHIYIR